jgi:protein O-GlcNAc transferase
MVKRPPSKKRDLLLQQTLARAMELHRAGLPAQAEPLYREVLALNPRQFEAQHLLGVLLAQRGRYQEALELVAAALKSKSDAFVALSDCGLILHRLGRYDEALSRLDAALNLKPDYAAALSNRGNVLAALHRYDDALASYEAALRVRPDYPEARINRGHVLASLGRHADALSDYDSVLAVRPDDAAASYGRGNVLAALGRYEEALAAYDRSLTANPEHIDALVNRGNALMKLRRNAEALASYDRALSMASDHVGALNNRGTALKNLGRFNEALADYDRALTVEPGFADALYNRGNVLKELKRYDDALLAYDKARAAKPDHPDSCGAMDAALAICDWERAEVLSADARKAIAAGTPLTPFTVLGFSDDPALHKRCAENFLAQQISKPPAFRTGAVPHHDKIRLAYLSADFREHATAYLIAELIERHDRSRFEVSAISFGRDDDSAMRRRLVAAFDRFDDVMTMADRDVAALLRDREIDIAVDLKGYTLECRPEILSYRPAPIQVNYLGYPGTMAADFMDYVIADHVVLPFDQQLLYRETIVQLPDCYQPNDRLRRVSDQTLSRSELGLQDNAFVFCCFNNNYKITRTVFDIWMRLLAAIPGSVLWLLSDNPKAEAHLQKSAKLRGVDPERLVFAQRMTLADHLARHRVADLFLDTLPYNAHTTASDALWAGLPLLTCTGRAFAGRVAASLLHAVGLPELVTDSLEAYESMALRLGNEPAQLAELRTRLESNRLTHPLFDTDRFRRHIEQAYVTMWERWQRGEPPDNFRVSATAAP